MNSSTLAIEQLARISNPFATRWVRPGAIPYQFPAEANSAALVERLRTHNWRGAILGPHGSGKSTLLATLVPQIQEAGRSVVLITLRDGQRCLPSNIHGPAQHGNPGLIVVDGYEQLGWPARWRLNSHCRRRGCGLLVTVHSEAGAPGIPVVFRTASNLATIGQLIDRHLPPHGELIRPDDIAAAFVAHRGNLRETFFTLYDLFEHRRRSFR